MFLFFALHVVVVDKCKALRVCEVVGFSNYNVLHYCSNFHCKEIDLEVISLIPFTSMEMDSTTHVNQMASAHSSCTMSHFQFILE